MATGTKKYILWRFCLCSLLIGTLSLLTLGVNANEEEIELQCRPYIERALKDLEAGEVHAESKVDSQEVGEQIDTSNEDNIEAVENVSVEENAPQDEESQGESLESHSVEMADEPYIEEMVIETDNAVNEQAADDDSNESNSQEEEAQPEKTSDDDSASNESTQDDSAEESAEKGDSQETSAEEITPEDENGITSSEAAEDAQSEEADNAEEVADDAEQASEDADSKEDDNNDSGEADSKEDGKDSSEESQEATEAVENASAESAESEEQADDSTADADDSKEEEADSKEQEQDSASDDASSAEAEDDAAAAAASAETDSAEKKDDSAESQESDENAKDAEDAKDESAESKEDSEMQMDDASVNEAESSQESEENAAEDASVEAESSQSVEQEVEEEASDKQSEETSEETETAPQEEPEETPEDDLLMEIVIPDNLRSKEHIGQLLRLDAESTEAELLVEKSADIMLRELKRLYDTAIKPLEILYKYRDLSNRHYGDPEIFSKPLVLFMGPWSGGKSSLINYLTDNEFTEWSLRTGAEPSPAYFNILMHGKEPEVLDGTQLAADWTFSGLQKFGQGLEERLRGLKLPNKLLERVNIVEIPGILEVRKQVSRVFPFNDACQWFIDRADIIFLVYDPSKLDVGPETEAILDQLKGRESQTRILLNKADQVKPEELMRVQSALIWNISPLMSSAQPPIMYTTSLWSMPYESGSPARLLQSQEKAFLRDLRGAIDKRIENKISSARRFAVRVRNHAKMVDCYLTTYYNHKTIFGNKKVVAEAIIEHPQNYHIYEGLSTLTNISRYDLPDPETYRDFFRLNPLYEFQQLSATCTYFRGCPINRLDIAIAYDLPELVGKYKKMVETVTPQGMPKS